MIRSEDGGMIRGRLASENRDVRSEVERIAPTVPVASSYNGRKIICEMKLNYGRAGGEEKCKGRILKRTFSIIWRLGLCLDGCRSWKKGAFYNFHILLKLFQLRL